MKSEPADEVHPESLKAGKPGDENNNTNTSEENNIQEEYTLEEAIDSIGFGKFHVLLTLCAGFLWGADAMEMMINSVLSPVLKCDWNLTSFQVG